MINAGTCISKEEDNLEYVETMWLNILHAICFRKAENISHQPSTSITRHTHYAEAKYFPLSAKYIRMYPFLISYCVPTQ